MSESNTPITDKAFQGIQRLSPSAAICEKLELENAELKRQLEEEKQSSATLLECAQLDFRDCKSKLSEYERQIKEGELVPVEVAVKWSREPKELCHSPRRSLQWFAGNQYRLKQFAAERAKEK